MRRHKTVARILLILSVVNVAFATPAIVREIHQVRGDVVDQPNQARQSTVPGVTSPVSDHPSSETPPEPNAGSPGNADEPSRHSTSSEVSSPSSKRPSSATLSDTDQGSTDSWDKSPEHSTTSDETPRPESKPPPSAAPPESKPPPLAAPPESKPPPLAAPPESKPPPLAAPPESKPPHSAAPPEPNKGTTISAEPAHPAPPAKKVKPKFFTEELKGRMMDYLVLGTVYGIYTGAVNAIQKEIMGSISPGAQTIQKTSRDLGDILNVPTTSSGAIGRGADTPLPDLLVRPQRRKNLVSRGLSNMSDEDLRLLSVLTRRAIERLD